MTEFVKKVVIDAGASTVRRLSTIRASKNASEKQMDVTYDFSNVAEQTLLDLASRTIHIAYQGAWRARIGGDDPLPLSGEVDVAEYLAAERRGGGFKASPKSLTKLAGRMTPEEIAETIRRLQEMQTTTANPDGDDIPEGEGDDDNEEA